MEPGSIAWRNRHPLLALFAGHPPASSGLASAAIAPMPVGQGADAGRSRPSRYSQPPVQPAGHGRAQPAADDHMKNSLELVASMLAMQARRTIDRSTSRVLDDVHDRLLGLAALSEQVDRCHGRDHVDLGTFLRDLAFALGRPDHAASLVLDVEPVVVSPMVALKFGLLVCELAAHASGAAKPPGVPDLVRIRLDRRGEGCRLTIADPGTRLAARFDGAGYGGLAHALLHAALAQLAATMAVVAGEVSMIVIEIPSFSLASHAQGEGAWPSPGGS